MSLIKNNNKVSITNSLKANGDNTYKVIEQLAKLGIFKTYKKRGPRKPKAGGGEGGAGGAGGETTEEEQKDDVSSKAEDAVNRILTTGNMLLSNITPRDGGFNNQRIEDIKREVGGQLAVIKDALDKQAERQNLLAQATLNLGDRFSQRETRFRSNGSKPNVQFFDDKDKKDMGTSPEVNEYDFTNEGSQNQPESVRQVDVSTQAPEIMEDEEPSGFMMIEDKPQDENIDEEEEEIQFKTIEEKPDLTIETEEPTQERKAERYIPEGFELPKNLSKNQSPLVYYQMVKPKSNAPKDILYQHFNNINEEFVTDPIELPKNKKITKEILNEYINKKLKMEEAYLLTQEEYRNFVKQYK